MDFVYLGLVLVTVKSGKITMACNQFWTKEEKEIIKRFYGKETPEVIASSMNKTTRAIYQYAYRTGLKIAKENKRAGRSVKKTFWTDDKIEYLKKNYKKLSGNILAKKFETTRVAIYCAYRKYK